MTGISVMKQVAIVNNLPFELKSIYGMQSEMDAVGGEEANEV